MQFLEQPNAVDQELLRDPEFLMAVVRGLSRNRVGDWRRGAFMVGSAPNDPTERIKPVGIRRLEAPGVVNNKG